MATDLTPTPEAHCPVCKRSYVPCLIDGDPHWRIKLHRWKEMGELIQNVWPHATSTMREQLQTGICSDKCWDNIFPPEED